MQLSSAAQVNIACRERLQQIVSVAESAARRLGYEQLIKLRDLQLKVVAEVVTGRDVFVILPGYGKSLCYALLPWMFDHLLQPDLPSIVAVLTPLTAIIKDQDCLG